MVNFWIASILVMSFSTNSIFQTIPAIVFAQQQHAHNTSSIINKDNVDLALFVWYRSNPTKLTPQQIGSGTVGKFLDAITETDSGWNFGENRTRLGIFNAAKLAIQNEPAIGWVVINITDGIDKSVIRQHKDYFLPYAVEYKKHVVPSFVKEKRNQMLVAALDDRPGTPKITILMVSYKYASPSWTSAGIDSNAELLGIVRYVIKNESAEIIVFVADLDKPNECNLVFKFDSYDPSALPKCIKSSTELAEQVKRAYESILAECPSSRVLTECYIDTRGQCVASVTYEHQPTDPKYQPYCVTYKNSTDPCSAESCPTPTARVSSGRPPKTKPRDMKRSRGSTTWLAVIIVILIIALFIGIGASVRRCILNARESRTVNSQKTANFGGRGPMAQPKASSLKKSVDV